MLIATFDIGTTAVKGVLVSEQGKYLCSESLNIETYFDGSKKEQKPEDWYRAFCEISRKFTETVGNENIDAIIMSGQMQDMIPVDLEGNPVANAILYSDGRAERESNEICQKVDSILNNGQVYLEKATGNHYDGSLTFPKVMWMKNNEPENFSRIYKVLVSSKDYVITKLTGNYCSDVVSCSTTGAMNIYEKKWDETIFEASEIPIELFPTILYSHEEAGVVTEEAAKESGYRVGTKVYAGTGDAGATTLASGISEPGEYNINLGTSGWVATVSDEAIQTDGGVFNLAAMPEERYINVVPFLNAGNVHKWITKIFSENEERMDYDSINDLLKESECKEDCLLFLPYLCGERFPVMDSKIRGCFYGITPETDRKDMARSCLEGVAFSIRQGIEKIGIIPKKISVIGGGARAEIWCQIMSDVLNTPLYVYKNAEVLPALAIASAVMLNRKKITGYKEFTDGLQQEENCIRYYPNKSNAEIYESVYQKYLRLYPAIRKMETE